MQLVEAAGLPTGTRPSSHWRGQQHPSPQVSCSALAYWPSTASLVTAGVLALLALVSTEVTIRRLVERPQPADDNKGTWTLEHTLRCRSARSAIAAATAMGLVLVAAVAEAVYNGAHSSVCPIGAGAVSLRAVGNVYSWAPSVTPGSRICPWACCSAPWQPGWCAPDDYTAT